MEPDTKTERQVCIEKYPNADFTCKHLCYNKHSLVYNPIGCTLDRYERDCDGKCSKYKTVESVFVKIINALFCIKNN